jgi:hypothetical protein
MTEYNKETLAQTIVYIAVGLVAFFTIIAAVLLINAGGWYAIPIPLAAICYGVYCFIKKYYPKKEKGGNE